MKNASKLRQNEIDSGFFIKKLILVSLGLPRKDFNFFLNIRGVIYIHNLKKNLLVQNTLGSQDSPLTNKLGSLDSLVYVSPESFFVNLS
jgi:hypothetical protein